MVWIVALASNHWYVRSRFDCLQDTVIMVIWLSIADSAVQRSQLIYSLHMHYPLNLKSFLTLLRNFEFGRKWKPLQPFDLISKLHMPSTPIQLSGAMTMMPQANLKPLMVMSLCAFTNCDYKIPVVVMFTLVKKIISLFCFFQIYIAQDKYWHVSNSTI